MSYTDITLDFFFVCKKNNTYNINPARAGSLIFIRKPTQIKKSQCVVRLHRATLTSEHILSNRSIQWDFLLYMAAIMESSYVTV